MTDSRHEPDDLQDDAELDARPEVQADARSGEPSGGEPQVSTPPVAAEPLGLDPVVAEPVVAEPEVVEPEVVEPEVVGDARVEPVAVEPVWARPPSPDPWHDPSSESTGPTPQPGYSAPTVEGEAPTQQVDQSFWAVDPAGSDSAQQPGGFQPPQHKSNDHLTAPGQTETAAYPQYPSPQYQNPQYQNPQYQNPQYPNTQYPQYVTPQGFGSPQGPGPAPSSDVPGSPEAAAPSPRSGVPGVIGFPGSAGDSVQPGAQPQNAPWHATLDPSAPGQPGQPQPGQPGQPQPGSGWFAGPVPDSGGRTGSHGRGALIALALGVGLLAGAVGGVAGGAFYEDVSNSSSGRNPTITLPTPVRADPKRPTSTVTTVADEVLPSVVSIKVRTSTESGTGSGFVIDAANGYILTNNHVVTAEGAGNATSIKVIFQDGTQVNGTVVGQDASYDLAVVKVKAKGLRQLQLGDSDAVRVGDPVVAIGAPLGLQGTVTTGIVSALNRPVAAGEGDKPAFINAIQTDAAINPGNSGGPLVDATGKVIAVNSAIAKAPGSTGSTSGNIGVGFAIPSNQARRTAQELIRTGHAEHPIIGVSLDPSYDGEGVKVSDQPDNGRAPVTAGGPADRAGIRPGDVITKIDGRVVTATDELIVAIRAKAPGATVTLTVRRGSSLKEVHVKLSAVSD